MKRFLTRRPIPCHVISTICHRAVLRIDHSTTKLRIVLDASGYYTTELCLNDILEAGPCLLPYLLDILLRFHTGKVAVLADIKQAFLQIEMNENDRNLVRFLCFHDIHKENPSLFEYHFTHLVFELTCSPFLLNATVRHHLTKYIDLEEIRHVIERLILNLYVDDSSTSFDELSDAIEFCRVAKSTLGDPNFDLRKWISNNFEFIKYAQSKNNDDMDLAELNDYRNRLLVYNSS